MVTYYVRASGGSNANDGLSFANGWATLAYATNTGGTGFPSLAAGDVIRVCADADYILTAAFTPGTTGVSGNPISLVGANATGTIDGTKPIIRPTTSAVTNLLTVASGITNWDFNDLVFLGRDTSNTKRVSVLFSGAAFNNASAWRFLRCEFTGATGNGSTTRSEPTFFIDCIANDNGGAGFGSNSATTAVNYQNCKAFDNTGDGIQCGIGASSIVINCSCYRNAGCGIDSESGGAGFSTILIGNNCYNNTLGGIRINSSPATPAGIQMNNTCSNNLAHGLILSNPAVDTEAEVRLVLLRFVNNHGHNNTGGVSNFTGLVAWSSLNSNNIEGDPLFANAATGDFTPTAGSALIGAGVGGHDIGARKYQPSGGGGLKLFPGFNGGLDG